MNIYAEAISGYLRKSSGTSWPDALIQDPSAWAGGDIIVGSRYWTEPRPPTRNWRLNRGFLSFDTSALHGRPVKDVALVLRTKERGALLAGALSVWSHGTNPFGAELDEGDWNRCNLLEATLGTSGLSGEVRTFVLPASINAVGQTQFRLRKADETTEPTGDGRVTFYGPDDATRRPYLMIDTGSVYDDVCTNLAAVLNAYKTSLGVLEVHDNQPETAEVDHVYVVWAGGMDAERQKISADVYWIGGHLGDTTGTTPSFDRAARLKADMMRRIIRMDGNCNGYCTILESCEAQGATNPTLIPWTNDELLLGVALRVTYLRELGEPGETVRI
jgi:hypothetical protein